MANEPLQSLPYPAASDSPDGAAQIRALALAVACLVTGRFASTAARDAAWTAYAAAGGRAPTAGDRAIIGSRTASTDTLWEWFHDGYQWQAITSPWQAITPSGGFTASGSVGVRLMGGVAVLRGSLTGSVAFATNVQIGTIPAGFAPTQPNSVARSASDDQTGTPTLTAWIDSSGAIWVRSQSATGTRTLSLGALSGYSLI